jgi:hypothetical protein
MRIFFFLGGGVNRTEFERNVMLMTTVKLISKLQ